MKKLITLLLFLPFALYGQVKEQSKSENAMNKEVSSDMITTDLSEKKEQKIVREPVCIAGNCENGTGTMNYTSGTYYGAWENGLRHGEGSYKWTNGDVYSGDWKDDKRHGQGQYIWKDGSKYMGNYSHGVRSGYGLYYYKNGSIYEGTWQNNLKHGIANFYYKESVNIGGRYINNQYVSGTGINQNSYAFKPKG